MKKSVSRRSFLAATMATGFVAGIAPKRTWGATKVADVIVIGAGMSGLSAAISLQDQGLNVLVLEADSRVGGRCYTMRNSSGTFDCGATTIGPYYGLVRTYAAIADVDLSLPRGRDRFSYHINGGFVHPDAWENSEYNRLVGEERAILPERLEFPILMKHNKIDDLAAWSSPEMLRYDVPLDMYLREHGASEEAIRLIGLTSNTMGLSSTSALFQMREFTRLSLPQSGSQKREVYAAGKDGSYHYVKGGTSVLVEGMAGLLKSGVRTNAAVTSILVEKDGVDVGLASGETLRAGSVICTAPFSAVRDIKISPSPTGKQKLAIDRSAYTLTTHVIFLPKKPYWDRDGHPAGLVSDDLIERVFAHYDDEGKVSWLDVWLNGAAAAEVDTYDKTQILALTQQRLEALRPSMKGALEPVDVYSWGQNPYVKGNKYIMRPGEAASMFPYLSETHAGRLFFAGEHTRDTEAGLEAAAATGVREASKVIERFG
ncbi:MAG: flavin monoamine oxidase family protein [Sphingomonadales bacterium]